MYKELQDIILETKKKFFSKLHGEHLSIFNGNGLEFNEVKEYTIDDDIRHINWKITARTRNPSVNRFFDHKQIQVASIYLNSGSLIFGEQQNKKSIATKLLSALSYLSVNSKDYFTSIFFDTNIQKHFQASNDKYTTNRIYEYANSLESKGNNIDYEKLQDTILENIPPRSILFLIGDFLELPKLSKLKQNYEIYVLIVRDINEEKINLKGENTFIDMNSLEKHNISLSNKTIKNYNEYMKEYDKKLFEIFDENHIHYKKFYTHEDTITKLREFLSRADAR